MFKNGCRMFLSILYLVFYSSCSDLPLFQQRYKTRVVARNQAGIPTIIRTYDLAMNELKKEEHYYNNGAKKHEGLYTDNKLITGSPVLWWYKNGQLQSRIIVGSNDDLTSVDIWYQNGVKQFSYYNNSFSWWQADGQEETSGTLYNSKIKLPIITNSGQIVGQRIADGLMNRTWQEEWILFDNENQREYSGLIKCTLTSRQTVHRDAVPGWIHDETGKRANIERQLQDMLDNQTDGYYFVRINKQGKKRTNKENILPVTLSPFLNGKEKLIFKARQFQRIYTLIFKADGTFIHNWEKGRMNKHDLVPGFAKGHYIVNAAATQVMLYYNQGLHAGEVHELDLASHREITYSFRGMSYFLR